MATIKARVGGAWVDSTLSGKVRQGGTWADFGPGDTPTAPKETLFSTQTPANPNWTESVPKLTLGTVINVTAGGQLTGGRWLFPTTIPAGMSAQFVLYDNLTGAELRRAGFSNPVAGSWAEVTFTPYPVEAGASLVAAVHLSGTQVAYPFTSGFFASGLTSGSLTGPQSSADPKGVGNGRFVNADAYPNSSYNSTCYFVDVAYEGVAPGTGGSVTLSGSDRPALSGQTVGMDVAATNLDAGETITSYTWSIRSGGGTLSSTTIATPTYTAPAGTGVAVLRATITTSAGRTGWADIRVGHGPNPVAAENQLPGVTRSVWDLPAGELAGIATLQGFCDGFTANRDETVNFKVAQSDSAGWTAQVYRLGWYGGDGARLVATLTPDATQLAASQSQPTPTDVDPDTTLPSLDCDNWATTLSWTPPAWAPSGMYVLRLNRTGGGASHVLFALRDDGRQADIMFMPSDSTWHAYNAFGGLGTDLYSGNSLYYGISVDQYHSDAARYVSYNRPLVNRGAADPGRSYGAVEWSTWFTGEYPMLRFLERNGFDLKYYGCIDAAADATGAKLASVKTAIAVGHNEYWSDGMRAGWEAAKANGTSLFFSAGNEVFWRLVGTNPDSAGRPRTWECQKSTLGGRGNTRPEWTGTWRDPNGAGKGGDQPENTLTGTIFVVNGPDLRSLVVPFDGGYSQQPLWRHTAVAALTAGQTWTSPNQILGFEWDTYGPAGTNGTGATYMADPHADARYCSDVTYTVPWGALLTDAGGSYGDGTATHRLVVHPGGSGALVFGSGTVNWALGCDNANTYQQGVDNSTPVIQQATINMLVDMGANPATLMAGLILPVKQDWYGGTPPAGETWALGAPANTDTADSALTTSVRFAVTAAGSWVGVRVWVTPTPPTITPSIVAYNQDTGVQLAVKQYTEPGTRGTYHDVLFDTPIAVTPGVNYQAAVHTDRYGYTASASLTLPLQSPSGSIYSESVAGNLAAFVYGSTPSSTPPANGSLYMHMAPIIQF